MPHPRWKSRLALALTTTLTASVAAVASAAPPAAAAQTIGLPTFTGPAVPAAPVGYTPGNMMQTIYNAESSGTDFWLDRMLGRSGGSDPADADGAILMSRGRAVFMKTYNPGVMGFAGHVAYWESISDANAYSITASPGTFTEQASQRFQAPSYSKNVFTGGSVAITQQKFITNNNVAVTNLSIKNNGTASTTLTLRAVSPYATSGSGSELTGSTSVKNGLTTLTTKLTGDGFAATSGGLNRSITIAAGATATAKVVMGFIASEIPESSTEYSAYAGYDNATAFATQTRTYNKWWADNIPFFDSPEPALTKNYYYRWWLMRFNNLDANIPGQTYQFPTSVEGALGYNNAIALTQPMHIDDLKYLRTPLYAYGDWLSVGQVSKNGRFVDNPGDPENWSNSYTQYIAEAAWRSYQIHGGQPGLAANLAQYAEKDVKGQLATYDSNNNKLIEYDWGALTGNDADAVSFHWRAGKMDRGEAAYQYSGARAAAQAYAAIGNAAKAAEMNTLADQIGAAIVSVLWNPNDQLFENRMASDGAFNPWKEINIYYPFAVGAIPDTTQYKQALRLFNDPAQYPIFPFYTANQADKAASGTGSNNFSTINSTVQFRLMSSVLRNYPNSWFTADWYKKLLYWNAWAQYVGGNTAYPDANEFWADWNGSSITYRSWIHHNILGSSNWTVIEDVAGLRPRNDAKVELSPINIGWDHFTVNNLRYRNADLSIVWDDPADGVTRYPGVPQGYSIFINGTRVATVNSLVPFTWDPATGAVTTTGTVGYSQAYAGLLAPSQVVQTDTRVVDEMSKAGIDNATSPPTNLVTGAAVSASYTGSGTSTGGASDGFPTNEPYWGAGGSPNAQDWFEVNFGQARTVNEIRLYFKDSRPASATYRAPSAYDIQYYNGAAWVSVPGQAKSQNPPKANYNLVTFPAISASRVRVLATNASGAKTGLTEIKAYNRGGTQPPPVTNLALTASPVCSFTSAWESCAAINNGDEPASSNIGATNDGSRWGTWPETGTQTADLQWATAQSVNKAQVYFFDDEGGIDMPSAWKLQYWNGTAYVDVPGASSYTITKNAYNTVTFTGVSTTRLRVSLTATGTASVGLLEVKAFG